MALKVALFSSKDHDRHYFDLFQPEFGHLIKHLEVRFEQKTAPLVRDADVVCLFVHDRANEPALRLIHEEGVRLIALRCAGFNNVDLKVAAELGLPVVRVPAYSPYAVAEHAMALVLTLNRKTHKAYNRVREGNFSLDRLVGFDLHDKTVAVIGTGKIGICFARIAKGLGCRLLGYDPYPNETFEAMGGRYVSLEEALGQSRIVSLHCPLVPANRHMINRQRLELMPRGAMLINTSRGGLVDTEAAIAALRSGQLGYLGIDVYEQEEDLFFEDYSEFILQDEHITQLMAFPNVLITSHQSFFTREALEQITRTTLQNISDFEAGRPLANELRLD